MIIKKGFLFCLLAICFSFNIYGQILEPVKWESKVEKISDTSFNLILQANIDKGWYIYSQTRQDPDGFAPETFFEFRNQDNNYKLEGKTSEPNVAPVFDEIFGENVKKFKDQAIFKQKITLLKADLNQVEVFVEYQTCDNSKCIPVILHLIYH